MSKSNTLSNIIYIWALLGGKRRWQFAGLIFLLIMSVFAEMISLGAVVPFLSALTDPQMVMDNKWLQPAIQQMKIDSAEALLLPMTIAFVAAAVFATGLRVTLLRVNTRLAASMALDLRSEIYRRTLYRPYEFHIAENSSKLISIVTEKVGAVISAAIMQVLMMTTSLLSIISVAVALLIINSDVALVSFVVLGGGYFLIGSISKNILKRNGQILSINQPLAIKQLQEGIGGIRDIILDHSQEEYIKNYTAYVKKNQWAGSNNAFVSQLPKSILELTGIILIAGLAYNIQMQGKEALPILGALALGAQRLLPSLQQVYYSWSLVIGNQAVINDVVSYLDIVPETKNISEPTSNPIEFNKKVELKNISFRYAGSKIKTLNNVTITIPKGSRVGIIGPTGCGKSTLLDIVMGLLKPSDGQLVIDNVVVDENNSQSWQKQVAHVPQSIYLSDATIEENIAFGISKDRIDLERVREAARQAHLDHFIEKLPNGYDTYVGERGVQLSGGQRQRIGIARALYKKTPVIVFDEATSALDSKTEAVVIEAIESLGNEVTIIMIAHRLSTLKGCNSVCRLSEGQVVEYGSYIQVCSSTTESI
ncbi:ABC transporter ATP-binding protein [Sulfurimonas sp. HSL1-2]|uniref:ABC transporter ATP-binding protein n=1 Tax=Thiomicrolovo zhangzhouensis TaxID=3131933 RepID=UPI0031F93FAC